MFVPKFGVLCLLALLAKATLFVFLSPHLSCCPRDGCIIFQSWCVQAWKGPMWGLRCVLTMRERNVSMENVQVTEQRMTR